MFDGDTLFEYLRGLKDRVLSAIIVQNPQDLNTAMLVPTMQITQCGLAER